MRLSDILFDRFLEKKIGKKRFDRFQKLEEAFNKKKSPDVLYLGDSVVERISFHDKDKVALGDLVKQKLKPGISAIYIAHTAYHLKVFYHLIKTLEVMRSRPRLIILPINIRSFSPQWHGEPSYQFEREIELIEKYTLKPSSRIGLLETSRDLSLAQERFKETPVEYPETDFKKIGQFLEIIANKSKNGVSIDMERWRQIFIFHYMSPLDPSHPLLSYLKKIIQITNSMKIKLLIYMTPVNYEAGLRYVGDSFMRRIEANQALLADFISKENRGNATVRNYMTIFKKEFFFSERDPSEHIAFAGRLELAKQIVREARFLL